MRGRAVEIVAIHISFGCQLQGYPPDGSDDLPVAIHISFGCQLQADGSENRRVAIHISFGCQLQEHLALQYVAIVHRD
jgi:hypothetical protein